MGVVLGRLGNPSPRRPSLAIRGGPHRPPKGRDGDAFARPSPRLATYAHPLATPALPHSPDFRGAVAKGTGRGFRVQRGPIRCGPCALYPLWGPPPPPTPPTDWPPTGQKGGYTPPHGPLRCPLPSPTGWPKGGLASGGHWGCGNFFFRTYPHYPFGVGGSAFRPASLKHFSQTNRPVKPITEKAAIRGFLFIFGF